MTTSTANIRGQARAHLLPHFTREKTWRDTELPVIVRGSGAYVFDDQEHRYLDGLSGLFCVNMGHGRSDFVAAAATQMQQLAYWTNWSATHPSAVQAATLIADLAPDGLGTTFFVNSGSEAVESALKFTRQFHLSQGNGQRVKFLARDMAYHGTTMGALSVTGIDRFKAPFGPLLNGVRHFPNTRGEKLRPGETAAHLPSIQALLQIIEEEGPETIAAVIAEPVQNAGGALVPPEGYWQELRSICDRIGCLLIADEVITAFGRIGEWFGSTRYGANPDLVTFAKGVTSGYAPLGGVLIRDSLVAGLIESPLAGTFSHGSTWGGHPVSTAVAIANLTAIRDEGTLNNVRTLEATLQSGLNQIRDTHPCVKDWRGTGFFHVIEFTGNRHTGRELTALEAETITRDVLPTAMKRVNLLTRADDRGGTMLVLSPPLIADREIVTELLDCVEAVVSTVETYLAT
ncbi:aminotransferase class III-fold pyridoxal phosphate-dependent enzyme [Paenarthrobacter ureafaciens]|uniref:aminotransferase class III-fold pyridoxal phosphate-dependent enzyme n=1 Tax=Paenarthrobacter ureafaciens TaxID=37931 RepID=UPI0019178B56|nr:aminotransferase class III-fold pyridoxal phosphate-dependent enzyme [Paenarthrobacter ureafaciens]QQQ64398.1 aminotransferase class III-fold pyridoxal phosphate-dependent enzyme [Paenarthrobacter ureafaciens]